MNVYGLYSSEVDTSGQVDKYSHRVSNSGFEKPSTLLFLLFFFFTPNLLTTNYTIGIWRCNDSFSLSFHHQKDIETFYHTLLPYLSFVFCLVSFYFIFF